MIAIIDYGAGNLTSVERAVQYLDYDGKITADPQTILDAEKVIFPGVGAARATMDNLNTAGLAEVLWEVYKSGKPMLGICIGIQILFEHSEEEDTDCLGILPGAVKKYDASPTQKVPQIGWNEVYQTRAHPIFRRCSESCPFLFCQFVLPDPAGRFIHCR